jgi:steroid 5-alpha reductase family enzyme
MNAVIDSLQKSAQASELDHTNTSPSLFLALSVLEVAVTQCIAYCFGWRWQLAAAFGIGGHWIGFVISLVIESDKFYDITEDIVYFLMMVWAYRSIDGAPSARQTLLFGCALLWCVRLCAFVGYRVIVRGSDWRFDKLIKAKAYNLFGWTSGGTWCWIQGFALWYAADFSGYGTDDLDLPLGVWDVVGALVFALGLTVELVSDLQKYAHNAAHGSGRNPVWISRGLWAWSRHPNYCGEIVLWSGMSIIAVGTRVASLLATVGPADAAVRYSLIVGAIPPLWSMVFFVFTSLMLLEKRADARWGGKKAYEEYKRKTPVLFCCLS